MPYIAPIVEGHGEVEAVPALLHRIGVLAGVEATLRVNAPIRRPLDVTNSMLLIGHGCLMDAGIESDVALRTAFSNRDGVGKMFAAESDMAESATRWLEAGGMIVKPEFVTPWGICDFVGLRFNQERVAHRLQLRQTKAVSSITRAVLLLAIPDIETKRSVSLDYLIRIFRPSIQAEVVEAETARLIKDRFVVSSSRRRLQKINGWMPLQDRLVAIELKLFRIEEAMRQATNNLSFADESYVGLPAEVAHRVALKSSRWSAFFDAGVGLLSVSKHNCDVLVQPRKSGVWSDLAIQLYCVEKFWRTRPKGS